MLQKKPVVNQYEYSLSQWPSFKVLGIYILSREKIKFPTFILNGPSAE